MENGRYPFLVPSGACNHPPPLDQLGWEPSASPAAPAACRGELSALACLGHLLDTERYVFPIRVGYFLAGQDFPAFNPEDEGTAVQDDTDPLEWARAFDRLRLESLVLFDRISAADLAKRARHAELGEVTLGEMLHEWAGHDMMHTVQAEQALMQPFIDGCGPWQVYFQAHWVKERGNLGHPQ